MILFDSHAHYDDARFDEDRDEILKSIHANGVARVVNVGSSLATSARSLSLAEKYRFVYAAVGVHPSDARSDMENGDWLSKLEGMARSTDKCRAVGEIGLDYYYGKDDISEQKECFRQQMALAEKLSLPVIVHDRDAHEDTLDIIKEFPNVRGVVHAFSGSFEMAKEVLKRGWYIGVGGVLTFKNARKLIEIVERLNELSPDALRHILTETDCPYLTPVPHRGERNRSDYMTFVAEKAASLLGMTAEEFALLTYQNACRFYGLPTEAE